MMTNAIIIGAGASGLMCARTLADRKKSFVLLDHSAKTGQKLLASGGGRCNFTNKVIDISHYKSQNPHFVRSALSRFGFEESISFFSKYGVVWKEEEEGKIFCKFTAREILKPFNDLPVITSCKIGSIDRIGDAFVVKSDRGDFSSRNLVIATGGLSYRTLGASGFGYDLAEKFGHRIIEPRPSLAQLLWSERDRKIFGKVSGVTVPATVQLGKEKFSGGLLFTHKGLSGPAIYNASIIWKRPDTLTIRLFDGTDILDELKKKRSVSSKQTFEVLLTKYIPRSLATAIFEYLGIKNEPLSSYPQAEFRRIVDALLALTFIPASVDSFDRAEATSGGIDTDQVSSKTFESKLVKGLYFTGEVLDVTGMVGGYNLHFAFASGYSAGIAI